MYCVLCTYCKYCTYLNTLKSLQCSDGPAATPAAVVPTEQLKQDPVETTGPGAMPAVVHIEQPEQPPVDEEDIDAQAEVKEAIVMQQAAIEVPPQSKIQSGPQFQLPSLLQCSLSSMMGMHCMQHCPLVHTPGILCVLPC